MEVKQLSSRIVRLEICCGIFVSIMHISNDVMYHVLYNKFTMNCIQIINDGTTKTVVHSKESALHVSNGIIQ